MHTQCFVTVVIIRWLFILFIVYYHLFRLLYDQWHRRCFTRNTEALLECCLFDYFRLFLIKIATPIKPKTNKISHETIDSFVISFSMHFRNKSKWRLQSVNGKFLCAWNAAGNLKKNEANKQRTTARKKFGFVLEIMQIKVCFCSWLDFFQLEIKLLGIRYVIRLKKVEKKSFIDFFA